MDHLRLGLGLAFLRDPRHVAVDNQHHVGFLEERMRIPAAMHRMLGRERVVARPVMHHRDGKLLRELLDGIVECRFAHGALDDAAIQRMDWLVEGVVGSIPGS